MAQSTITNGETGLAVRSALNSMFTELYASVAAVPGADGRTFHVNQTYGAVAYYTETYALSGPDDTDKIQQAIDDAVSAGGGTVAFNPGFYNVSGAVRTDRSGRAQIALPIRTITPTPTTQVCVHLYCHEPAQSSLYNFGVDGVSGAVLCSTLTSQALGGGGQVPSVIGGPATTMTYSTPASFTNLYVVVEGIAIRCRADPTLTGFDFGGVLRCYLKDFRVEAASPFGITANCTSPFACGVIMPQDNNNVLNQIDVGHVHGFYAGMVYGEHTNIGGTLGLYENNIALASINTITHNLSLGPMVSIQSSNYIIAGLNFSTGVTDVPGENILDGWFDIEDSTDWFAPVTHIKDASNKLSGKVRYSRGIGGTGPTTGLLTVTGCARLKLEDIALGPGRFLNAQTGTTYTFKGTDSSSLTSLTNASAITATVPANSTVPYPVGTTISFYQGGAGQVTVSAAGGVTVNSYGGKTKTAGQHAFGFLEKVATNTWELHGGDLTT
jgi:hypothetical protein